MMLMRTEEEEEEKRTVVKQKHQMSMFDMHVIVDFSRR